MLEGYCHFYLTYLQLPCQISTGPKFSANSRNFLAARLPGYRTFSTYAEFRDYSDVTLAWDDGKRRQVQSRRLDLTTTTFLWPEQRCKILCIFCYSRFALGQSKVALARATLPIPLYFLQHSCQGRPLRSGNLKLPEIQRNW